MYNYNILYISKKERHLKNTCHFRNCTKFMNSEVNL